MKTIAVINQKGGVGKTAISYNLSYQYASEGMKTLLVDLDPSSNATRGFNFTDYDFYSGHLFTESNSRTYSPSVSTYAIADNLWIIPSRINLALVQRQLACKTYRETILKKQLAKFKMDICLIDCSPTLSDLNINAIYASDLILIPVTYADDALEGLADLFQVIDEIKEGQNYEWRIVLNQKDSRKKRTNDYIENKLADFDKSGNLFETKIRQDESMNQAKIERKTIFEFAPKSNGATDLSLLAKEILSCLN